MDSEQNHSKPGYIYEYDEAVERFENSRETAELNRKFSRDLKLTNNLPKETIEKLCSKNSCLYIGEDSSLFYKTLICADFLQLKEELLPNFYSELCSKFILSDLIEDIIENLHKIDKIAHIKIFIVQGFFMILQVLTTVKDGCLILTHSKEKLWSKIKFSKVRCIRILPCAFKVMFTHEKFSFTHLNLILRLLEIKELSLHECNLNGKDTSNLFRGLSLKDINLSECGAKVNRILQMNTPGLFECLTSLNVEGNILSNETLQIMSFLPLASLTISRCIKVSDESIETIPFQHRQFYTEVGLPSGNIDLLWNQKGKLRNTLKILCTCYNLLSVENLQNILNMNLIELDITGCLKQVSLTDVTFPSSLKVLKVKGNRFTFCDLKQCCTLKLRKLEFNYEAAYNDDFSTLISLPLMSTLKELSVNVAKSSESFTNFSSKFKLNYFHCFFKAIHEDNSFMSLSEEEKGYSRIFLIHGSDTELVRKFITEIKNFSLTGLSITLEGSDRNYFDFFACESLQKTLISLELINKKVENSDILEILKFKKLKKLIFTYSNNLEPEFLENLIKMESLKQLDMTASIEGQLNLNMAHLLCIAPPKTLKISCHCTITDDAYEFLSKNENLTHFSAKLKHLHAGFIPKNVAKVLVNAQWESITLDRRKNNDSSVDLTSETENLECVLKSYRYSVCKVAMNVYLSVRCTG